ncbi:MAG: DUF6268 family outer membrane beta-barrel protein [bacterium]
MRYFGLILWCALLPGWSNPAQAASNVLSGGPLYAPQPTVQRIYFGYQYHFQARQLENETTSQDGLKIASSLVELGLTMPIFFSEGRTMLAGGLAYRGWQFIYENYHRTDFLPDALHELRYSISLERRPTAERSWRIELTPGIVSDFEEINGDDFGIEGQLLYNWHSSETVWGLGAAYLDVFGKSLPMPLLQFSRDGETSIDILLPLHFILSRELDDGVSLGLQSTITGGRFHLGEDFELPDKRSSLDGRVEYFLWQADGEIVWHPGAGLEFSLRGGVDLIRRFQINDVNGEGISSLDLKPGPYLGIELGLRR